MCWFTHFLPLINSSLFLSASPQYKYTDLAAKERAHFTPASDTPNLGHARKMKVVYSDVSLPIPHVFFIFVRLSLLFIGKLLSHLYNPSPPLIFKYEYLNSVCVFIQWYFIFLMCCINCFSSLRTNTKNSMRRWSTDTRPLLIHLSWSVPRSPTSSPVMWVCSLVYCHNKQ